jgi:protein SCO1/2
MRRWALSLSAAVIAALSSQTAIAGQWGADYFPNTPVIDETGRTLSFYDDVLRGRIVVISFVYTSCRDLCPINTARLAAVANELRDVMGKSVFFVSISVDPQNDTPERLKAFKDAFYDGPGWTFLTGEDAILREIGSKLGNDSNVPSQHRNEIILGNEATSDWARNTPFGEIGMLASTIRDLDPQWREQERIPSAQYLKTEEFAHLQLSDQQGQVLFQKMCAPCHTVGVGDRVGPDLMGVTERRSEDWLVDFIRDPEALRRIGDPQAAELMARFPGARMPSFGLTEVDARDLISFLKDRTETVLQARSEAIAHDASHAEAGEDHSHHTHQH